MTLPLSLFSIVHAYSTHGVVSSEAESHFAISFRAVTQQRTMIMQPRCPPIIYTTPLLHYSSCRNRDQGRAICTTGQGCLPGSEKRMPWYRVLLVREMDHWRDKYDVERLGEYG